MFDRPRCRNWSPLATQQLRLRNLIGIKGQSIVCSIKSKLYFTLHFTAMSAPFYTSEKVDSHGSGYVDWPEINCPLILKSTAKSVCIRVWEHIPSSSSSSPSLYSTQDIKENSLNNKSFENEYDNLSFQREESPQFPLTSNNNADKMLFIWGVYFSGLILLTKRSDVKFVSNSLIFQMHGGYFASASTLTLESMRQQLKLTYQLDQDKNQEKAKNKEYSIKVTAKSCDIFSNINSNNLTLKKNLKNKNPKDKTNEFQINSPRSSRSCSPIRNENCMIPGIDVSKDLLAMLEIRYIDKIFLTSEIRPSYNLTKLLDLQERQRKFKHRNEEAKEIIEKICTKSAFCLNLELISNKGLLYRQRNTNNLTMGRTLNRLLYQEHHIKPEDLLRAQELRRKIETARLRCRSLQQQRVRAKINLKQLEKKLCELHDSNIEQESFLMAGLRNLSREKEYLLLEEKNIKEKQENLNKLKHSLNKKRKSLCSELIEIYPIERKAKQKYTIANIYLPNADKLNDIKVLSTKEEWERVSQLSLGVAYGYVAHITQVSSVILNLPLRNPIKHEGSRSKILDIIKNIPNTSREFPLFNRSGVPSKQFIYAIFLLNQNIAQLNFQVHNKKCDLKATLKNLLKLLDKYDCDDLDLEQQNSNYEKEENQDDINHLLGIEQQKPSKNNSKGNSSPLNNSNQKDVSVSGSSVDLSVPLSSSTMLMLNTNSNPVNFVNTRLKDQRISRSVGSYSNSPLSSSSSSQIGRFHLHNSEPILNISHHEIHISHFNENEKI